MNIDQSPCSNSSKEVIDLGEDPPNESERSYRPHDGLDITIFVAGVQGESHPSRSPVDSSREDPSILQGGDEGVACTATRRPRDDDAIGDRRGV